MNTVVVLFSNDILEIGLPFTRLSYKKNNMNERLDHMTQDIE
jgi:hypothetical protein